MADQRCVWVGSLHAYNSGALVGSWYDADEAPTDPSDWINDHRGELVAAGLETDPITHEELWCFDHEGYPKGTGEMSPDQARRMDAAISEASDGDAFLAFLSYPATGEAWPDDVPVPDRAAPVVVVTTPSIEAKVKSRPVTS